MTVNASGLSWPEARRDALGCEPRDKGTDALIFTGQHETRLRTRHMPVTAYGRTVSEKEICVVAANHWARERKLRIYKIAAEVFFVPSDKVGNHLANKIRGVLVENGYEVPEKRRRSAEAYAAGRKRLLDWLDRENAKQHIKPHVITVSLEGVAQS